MEKRKNHVDRGGRGGRGGGVRRVEKEEEEKIDLRKKAHLPCVKDDL